MMKAILNAAAGGVMLSATVCAAGPVDQVTRAIRQMDERDRAGWAFVRTIQTENQVLIARYDPRQGHGRDGWRLDRVNGKSPTEEDTAAFYQQIDQAAAKSTRANGAAPANISTVVRLESLRVVSTNAMGQTTFAFKPSMNDAPPENADLIKGELVFDPESQRLVALSVWNTAPYSPAFAVKISTLDMRMRFEPVEGYVLLTEMSTRIQGKRLFMKIDEKVLVSFSDYEWVGE